MAIKEINPQDVLAKKEEGYQLIDVREVPEFTGELSHVDGAELIPLSDKFESWVESADKSGKYIFICRSGGRSGRATDFVNSQGFSNAYNMKGGMILWNELKLPVA